MPPPTPKSPLATPLASPMTAAIRYCMAAYDRASARPTTKIIATNAIPIRADLH
jgi:hypothetical protein